MCQRGVALFFDDDGDVHEISTADGGDQGDPLMPVAFAYGILEPLHRIRLRLQALVDNAVELGIVDKKDAIVRVLSYLDDITLLIPPSVARPALEIAREELASVNLCLNDGKTNLYCKSGVCPEGCEQWWLLAVKRSLCRYVAMSLCRYVAMSLPLCRYVAMSLCRYVAMSLCRYVAIRYVAMSLCRYVAMSLCRYYFTKG